MENKDSFGLAADDYRHFRPTYPEELFGFLASLCRSTGAALDCATGNGQAAVDLALRFERVAAFDSSEAQIAAAVKHPRVEYRVGTAEALPFTEDEFDLVTAAQAAHWFDLQIFYEGLRRIVKPASVIAIWGYSYCNVGAAVDEIVAAKLLQPIAPYWAQGNRVILEKYRTIYFPFAETPWPGFAARHEWTRANFLGYMGTWSAYKRFIAANHADPMPALDRALAEIWPADEPRTVTFELVGRVGRFGREQVLRREW
jgi:ubiquinone/menaquinone biosynthesis C-methylase UbiE